MARSGPADGAGKMIKQRQKERKKRMLPILMVLLIFSSGGITVAWMNSGYVECSGYLKPDSWAALYTAGEGFVADGSLGDGMPVSRGDRVLLLDDEWPRWNLERITRELRALDVEITAGETNLALFLSHREIEEEELTRIVSADRLLFANSSLTMNDLRHDEYLRHTFSAGADREQASLLRLLSTGRQKKDSLKAEFRLWENRVKKMQVVASESGVFFSVETVMGGASRGLIPPVGPGRFLESGRLLGYIIPDRGMLAHVEIPQHRVDRCHPGQMVLLSVDARSLWRYPPVKGRLESITKMASGDAFHATVSLSVSDQTLDELKVLSGGNLTARIDTRAHRFPVLNIPETWALLVNSPGNKQW